MGLALLLWKSTLNVFSMIGLAMLMGLVTKNAILLVDFANQARKAGATVADALLEVGLTRMRPIVMTTAAMVFGMLPLPLALALNDGGELQAPMGRAIIGGVITSTLLTLVVRVAHQHGVLPTLDGLVLVDEVQLGLCRVFAPATPAALDLTLDLALDLDDEVELAHAAHHDDASRLRPTRQPQHVFARLPALAHAAPVTPSPLALDQRLHARALTQLEQVGLPNGLKCAHLALAAKRAVAPNHLRARGR